MEGYIQEYETDSKLADITNRFTYHTPIQTQAIRYENIRDGAKSMALMLNALCPPSRELSLAMTNLEQAIMWANAAIARNEKPVLGAE